MENNQPLSKIPLHQLTKEQFNEAYNSVVEKYTAQNKYLSRDLVLHLALSTGQITEDKYNELL